jgi:putative ABC transport system substrate-binding protein
MKRRNFIGGLVGAAASPLMAHAQQTRPSTPRIGFLGSISALAYAAQLRGFRAGLKELGYTEGENINIDYRWAEGKYDQLEQLAFELVRLRPDVLVTHGTPASFALEAATKNIPIVMAVTGDAVGTGLVESIARPGGNITGISFYAPELSAKRLEILVEAMPSLRRVAALFNSGNSSAQLDLNVLNSRAASLGMQLQPFEVQGADAFQQTISTIKVLGFEAVALIHDAVITASLKPLANLTLAHRLASIGEGPYVRAGGLIGYGPDFPDLFRRSASFVDRILKGGVPRDMPVEQPTKFEFFFNNGTARALGLTIPPSLLARADEVIE